MSQACKLYLLLHMIKIMAGPNVWREWNILQLNFNNDFFSQHNIQVQITFSGNMELIMGVCFSGIVTDGNFWTNLMGQNTLMNWTISILVDHQSILVLSLHKVVITYSMPYTLHKGKGSWENAKCVIESPLVWLDTEGHMLLGGEMKIGDDATHFHQEIQSPRLNSLGYSFPGTVWKTWYSELSTQLCQCLFLEASDCTSILYFKLLSKMIRTLCTLYSYIKTIHYLSCSYIYTTVDSFFFFLSRPNCTDSLLSKKLQIHI